MCHCATTWLLHGTRIIKHLQCRARLPCTLHSCNLVAVRTAIVCVVFTLNHCFYPTTSVHAVSVLILHPREIQILWSQTVRQRETKTTTINQGKAGEMLAYLVREHQKKTSQTRKKEKEKQ